jgi:TPR repeat/Tetratricopeptide repeat
VVPAAVAEQALHGCAELSCRGSARKAARGGRAVRAVLEENESDFDCLPNLGLLHAREGRFNDAVGLLRADARQDPRSVEVHDNLANVLAILERHDEVVAGFRIAIADFGEAHNNLGNALAVQGRTDDAIGHYVQALALRPDYADVHVNLGNSLAERDRLEEAAPHPALKSLDQLGGFVLAEHMADRRRRHHGRAVPVEFMAFAELRALIDALDGGPEPGMEEGRGIHDDDAKELAADHRGDPGAGPNDD